MRLPLRLKQYIFFENVLRKQNLRELLYQVTCTSALGLKQGLHQPLNIAWRNLAELSQRAHWAKWNHSEYCIYFVQSDMVDHAC